MTKIVYFVQQELEESCPSLTLVFAANYSVTAAASFEIHASSFRSTLSQIGVDVDKLPAKFATNSTALYRPRREPIGSQLGLLLLSIHGMASHCVTCITTPSYHNICAAIRYVYTKRIIRSISMQMEKKRLEEELLLQSPIRR